MEKGKLEKVKNLIKDIRGVLMENGMKGQEIEVYILTVMQQGSVSLSTNTKREISKQNHSVNSINSILQSMLQNSNSNMLTVLRRIQMNLYLEKNSLITDNSDESIQRKNSNTSNASSLEDKKKDKRDAKKKDKKKRQSKTSGMRDIMRDDNIFGGQDIYREGNIIRDLVGRCYQEERLKNNQQKGNNSMEKSNQQNDLGLMRILSRKNPSTTTNVSSNSQANPFFPSAYVNPLQQSSLNGANIFSALSSGILKAQMTNSQLSCMQASNQLQEHRKQLQQNLRQINMLKHIMEKQLIAEMLEAGQLDDQEDQNNCIAPLNGFGRINMDNSMYGDFR